MGLRAWAKKTAKKGKKAAKDVGKKVKHTAKDTGKKVEKTADKAVDGIKKAANTVADEVKNLPKELQRGVMSILDDVKKLANKAEAEIRRLEREAKEGINTAVDAVKKEVIDEIKGAGQTVIGEIETTFEKRLPDLIIKQAPKLAVQVLNKGVDFVEEVAADLQKAITGPGLIASKSVFNATYSGLQKFEKAKPELVELLNRPGFDVRVGPIAMHWEGVYTRAETILGVFDKYINAPPRFGRKDLADFLRGFGPDEIEIDASIKANVVVVGSSVMEFETKVPTIPFEVGIFILDEILIAAGVPE